MKNFKFVEDRVLDKIDLYLVAQYDVSRVKNMFKNRYCLEIQKVGNTKKYKELWVDFSKNAEGFVFRDEHNTPNKFRCKLYFEKETDLTWFVLRIAGDFI